MRINDILIENQINEGPLDTIGKGVGKAVGGVAKGLGAVAGGVAGIPGAFKKGFQAGKTTVAGTPNAANTAQDKTQANLAKTGNPVGAPGAKPTVGSKVKGFLDKMDQAVNPQAGAIPANIQQQIDKLDPQQAAKLYNLL